MSGRKEMILQGLRSVRCAALELLRQLAEYDDEGQEIIAKTVDISRVIKMLSSNHGPIRHASVSLLFVLSRSQFLCDEIGAVAGENGYWEPLLNHLVEGTEEMRMEMANYLGEIVLGPESKTYVAEKASLDLIQMVHTGNSLSRNAAFKALKQISCYHPNAKTLVEDGIIIIMVEEMFTRTIHNEPMNSKTEASAILANILESGQELEDFQVNVHGDTMSSDYIAYNVIYQIKNSTPDELNINLIRILLCLMKFPKASATIVSVIKETEASYNLIELINTPNEYLGVVSIKLLITLSVFMGHTLSTRLCKTRGQPESLIQNPTEITRITEKDAVSVNFLAKLPHQNLTLNLALVNRLTTTLYDHQILLLARTYNFTSVLTELLAKSYTDEVHKLSAIGLENLSKQSINLSRSPQMAKTKILKFFIFQKCISTKSSKGEEFSLCPIHRGVCSSQDTFCLLDAKADERLLACLDHENVEVVKAALSALCTLLDDNVDVDKSVSLLCEKHAIQHVLNVVKEHREEALWQKSFWVIERFLLKGGDKSASDISQDRLLPSTLVSAFHHGDECTRQMAEKILRSLNKMPTLSNTFTIQLSGYAYALCSNVYTFKDDVVD
ncbi:putative U-box domain-containing protein 42 [Abeliophyllum distichum]|uniref:U-box domain-containing protein 42 n=1 Tax=Abeliophyllum distichum TaxID=126358 RepID=A0ABD1U2M3_9LAMI